MKPKEKDDDMRERYIAPAIMLIAGTITSILNIVNGVKTLNGLISLLIVLIIFFILGKIVTVIIRKATAEIKEKPEETSSEEENTPLEVVSPGGEMKTEDSSEIK